MGEIRVRTSIFVFVGSSSVETNRSGTGDLFNTSRPLLLLVVSKTKVTITTVKRLPCGFRFGLGPGVRLVLGLVP